MFSATNQDTHNKVLKMTHGQHLFKPHTIPFWRITTSAYVFPHLELKQKPSTQKEMIDICKELKSELLELDIYIYSQGEYCKELNADWNVCISIKEKDKEIKYTYIIRSCDDFNKTYGCPFVKSDYLSNYPGKGINGLKKDVNEKLFNIVESKLMELMPDSKKVDYFDT